MSDAIAFRDRYADAVRARRAELRADRALLLGGHRAELRGCLAAARLTASAELAASLADLEREVRRHADHAGRAGRAALPGLVEAAVCGFLDQVTDRWVATVLPGIRRVAAVRCHDLTVAGPVAAVLLRRPAVTLPAPDPPPGAVRALLAGATEGTWRVALLPAAVLPAVGLPAVAGRSALPLAVGVGLALLAAAVQARRAAADRVRLRRWAVEVASVLRNTLEAELGRRLLEVERLATAGLDDAVARRRGEVEAALRALAADPPAVATAGR